MTRSIRLLTKLAIALLLLLQQRGLLQAQSRIIDVHIHSYDQGAFLRPTPDLPGTQVPGVQPAIEAKPMLPLPSTILSRPSSAAHPAA
ncbi:hypothetical protein [Fibrella forsythiae]|uniref:Amidohydrolase n=1 Tax=Fibrella forsythiae TaxID=2817061 RepID=A0ABS3JTY8_9BACT|nr:hypothetical protein [Fibrella forsythiae]MBO0952918.1 hypothetical protein [Fibrella forsythiae]